MALRTHLNTHAYLVHLYGSVRVAQVKKCRVSRSCASFCSASYNVRTKLRHMYVQQARIHRFDVLLTVHLSIFILVISQIYAQNFV